MKTITKICMMLTLVVGLVALNACQNGGNDPSANALANTKWFAMADGHAATFTFKASTLELEEKEISSGDAVTLRGTYTFDGTTVSMTWTGFSDPKGLLEPGTTVAVLNQIQPRTATVSGTKLLCIGIEYTKK